MSDAELGSPPISAIGLGDRLYDNSRPENQERNAVTPVRFRPAARFRP